MPPITSGITIASPNHARAFRLTLSPNQVGTTPRCRPDVRMTVIPYANAKPAIPTKKIENGRVSPNVQDVLAVVRYMPEPAAMYRASTPSPDLSICRKRGRRPPGVDHGGLRHSPPTAGG